MDSYVSLESRQADDASRKLRRRKVITGALVSLAIVCVVLAVTLTQGSGSSSSSSSAPSAYHVQQGSVAASVVPFEGDGDVSSFLQCRFAKASASSYDCETANPLLYAPNACLLALYRNRAAKDAAGAVTALLTCGGPQGKDPSSPDLTPRGTLTVSASKFDSASGTRHLIGSSAEALVGALPSETTAPQTWTLADNQARSFAVSHFKRFALSVDSSKAPVTALRVLSADGSVRELPNVNDEVLVVAGEAPSGAAEAALRGTSQAEVVSATTVGASSAIFASRSDNAHGFEAHMYDASRARTHTIRYSLIKGTDARVRGVGGALNVSVEDHAAGRRFWTLVSTQRQTGREVSLDSAPSTSNPAVITSFHDGVVAQTLVRGKKADDARASRVFGNGTATRPQWALDALNRFHDLQFGENKQWLVPKDAKAVKPMGEADDLLQCAHGVYSSYESCKSAYGDVKNCVECGASAVETDGAALEDPAVLRGCVVCVVGVADGDSYGDVKKCVQGLGGVESNCDAAYHDVFNSQCHQQYGCGSCNGISGCHWCGSSCHAYLSIYGCLEGSSCN